MPREVRLSDDKRSRTIVRAGAATLAAMRRSNTTSFRGSRH